MMMMVTTMVVVVVERVMMRTKLYKQIEPLQVGELPVQILNSSKGSCVYEKNTMLGKFHGVLLEALHSYYVVSFLVCA